MIPSIGAVSSGLQAVRRGVSRLDAAAADLSTAFLPLDDASREAREAGKQDVVGALVEMMLARRQVGIGARVIERASRAQEDVLDILA